MSERLYALLTRIAVALEAQREPEEDVLEFPLSDFAAFPWSTIGATIVQRDADGVSIIRTAAGKMAKRRSNDKFGTEVWFSYSDGKDERGENRYRKVIVFRNVAPPEPLGRKTEQAVKASTPSQPPAATEPAAERPRAAGSPLMPHLIERHKALSAELVAMGDTVPAELTLGADTTPPVAQGILDKLARLVSQRRDSHRTPADPNALAASQAEIDAAIAWLRDAPRATADNMGKFAKELADHMFLCGFKPPANAYNLNAKREAFAEWLTQKAVTA